MPWYKLYFYSDAASYLTRGRCWLHFTLFCWPKKVTKRNDTYNQANVYRLLVILNPFLHGTFHSLIKLKDPAHSSLLNYAECNLAFRMLFSKLHGHGFICLFISESHGYCQKESRSFLKESIIAYFNKLLYAATPVLAFYFYFKTF